jgi:hypothetical protein
VTPLGHLAISVLLVHARRYAGRAAALCLAGAVVPDLVDKPLVAAGVVDVSHTVGHSVPVLGVAAGATAALPAVRPAAPLVAGWAAHVAADLVVAYPRFLVNYAWPLLAPRPTPDDPLVAYWLEYAAGPLGAFEASLVVLAGVLLSRRGLHPAGRPGDAGR